MIKINKNNILSIFLCVFFCGLPFCLFSQQDSTKKDFKNAVYLEIGGNAGAGSVNYERVFFKKNIFTMTGRIGFLYPAFGDKYYLLNPVIGGLLIGKNRNYLEIGNGMLLIYNFDKKGREKWKNETIHATPYPKSFIILFSPSIGYRYISKSERFIFRADYTPLIMYVKEYFNWAGISIGYNF